MDLHDYLNIHRVFRTIAEEWNCPVWMAKLIVQQTIDQIWEKAESDPDTKARFDQYFPDGKPTPTQYILRLGHAHESGEELPYFLDDPE